MPINTRLDVFAPMILHQLKASIVVVNARGELLFMNPEAKALYNSFGVRADVGQTINEIFNGDRKSAIMSTIAFVLERRQFQVREFEFKDKENRSVYLEESYSPLADEETTQLVCILSREITSTKTIERKSSQLAREFHQLNNNANALIFATDTQGYITDWNLECERVTGLSRNDALTQRVSKVIHQDSEKAFELKTQEVLKGEAVRNFECLLKNGRDVIHALVNVTPRRNTHGQVVGAWFVGQDISELTRYRVSLEEKVRDRTLDLVNALEKEKQLVDVKNKFISIASHEFKMPLQAITAALGLIAGNGVAPQQTQTAIQTINKQVMQMRGLLDDILTIEKTDNLKVNAIYSTFDLVAFLKTLMDEVTAGARHSHRVEITFSHDTIFIDSDVKLLRQVFLNLVGNAIKFSPGKDIVSVSVINKSLLVEIKVTDYGIGIPPSDLEKLFEPFHRGSNANSIEGTGLGLSIVKKAVDILGGLLTIESNVGEGTSFTVKLKTLRTN